jgi:NarL family two-component system response regulator LiaR
MNVIRVLIVDDHVVVRRGIQMFMGTDPSIKVVGEAEDCIDAVRKAKQLKPDVILMDLVMPGGDGIDAIAEIKRRIPDLKIIVLTTFGDEPRVRAAMEAGADGYLLKDADGDALLEAVHSVKKGDIPLHPRVAQNLVKSFAKREDVNGNKSLTEREREILELVSKGLSNRAIAEALNLSTGTVKVHVSNILGKLDVANRTEATMRALQMGLIPPVENQTTLT